MVVVIFLAIPLYVANTDFDVVILTIDIHRLAGGIQFLFPVS